MVQVNMAKAKSSFSEYASRAAYTDEQIIITKRGKPFVALISVNDLEFLQRIKAGHPEDGLLGAVGMPLAWPPSWKKWLKKPWRPIKEGLMTLAER